MLLEGIDPRISNLTCVLSVSQVRGFRIRLHFEGYDSCYDFWRNADSKFIFPVGYCKENGIKLMPPYGKFLKHKLRKMQIGNIVFKLYSAFSPL